MPTVTIHQGLHACWKAVADSIREAPRGWLTSGYAGNLDHHRLTIYVDTSQPMDRCTTLRRVTLQHPFFVRGASEERNTDMRSIDLSDVRRHMPERQHLSHHAIDPDAFPLCQAQLRHHVCQASVTRRGWVRDDVLGRDACDEATWRRHDKRVADVLNDCRSGTQPISVGTLRRSVSRCAARVSPLSRARTRSQRWG